MSLEQAEAAYDSEPDEARRLAQAVFDDKSTAGDAKDKEGALVLLGRLAAKKHDAAELQNVIRSSQAYLTVIAKAKTAKLIRRLIDLFGDIPGSSRQQVDITKEFIEWARTERRVFLRQSLETRLIAFYLDSGNHREAIKLVETLLKELRRLDDKIVLTEAKAALTSARTAANAIYCPPNLQNQLDLQSGILHAGDKDYTTAFSYLFEAMEGFSTQDDPRASQALKYMLLCKIMLSLPADVTSIIQSKLAQRYAGKDVDAMKAVAIAHENRSLSEFERVLQTYKSELSQDAIIKNHLAALYDTLLEQNLLKVVEPYSKIELEYIAQSVQQPTREIESKISQLILDKKLFAIIDQGSGCLEVFDEPQSDVTYDVALDTLKQVGQVVDTLYAKAMKL